MPIKFSTSLTGNAETVSVLTADGGSIDLSNTPKVILHTTPESLTGSIREGSDLLLEVDGEILRLENFYTVEPVEVQFYNPDTGTLMDLMAYPAQSSGFVPIDLVPLASADTAAAVAASSSSATGALGSGLGFLGAAAAIGGVAFALDSDASTSSTARFGSGNVEDRTDSDSNGEAPSDEQSSSGINEAEGPASIAPSSPPLLAPQTGDGVNGNNITSDSTPTFIGEGGTPGATVTLYDAAGNVLGTGIVAEDGSWSVTPDSELPEGSTELTVTYTDEAGNESTASEPLTVTVESLGPGAPASTPDLDSVSDNRALEDGVTSDTKPTITGKGGTPGDEVTLYDSAGNVLGTGIVAEDGSWSITPDSDLPEGTTEFTVTYADKAGNESAASAPLTVTEESPGPDAPASTPVLDSASDTGTPGDGITSNTTPTLTGTGGTPGDEVTLYDAAGNVLGMGTVEADGSWSVTPGSDLPEGTTELTVTYADEAGNESAASAPLTVTVDSTTPEAPANAPVLDPESDTGAAGDNITSDATPTLTGTGGTPGDEVTLYDAAGNVLGTGIVAEDGSWSVTPDSDLPEGTTELTVTYADEAGNESAASAPLTVTVESTGPDAPASAPVLDSSSDTGVLGDGVTSDTSPTLTGTGGTAGDEVTLYDAAGNVLGTGIVAEDGSWSVTPDSDLPEGTTELTVTYADEAGNESVASAPLTVTIDSTAPDTPVSAPGLDAESDTGAAGDNITSDATPTVTGTDGTPGDIVTLFDDAGNVLGTVTVEADGSWSVTPDSDLPEGTTDLTVTYADEAGNESVASAPLTVTVDSTAPEAPANAPVLDPESDTGAAGDNITSDATPTLTGTGGTPGDEVTLYDAAGNVLGTGTVEADGSWSVTPDSDLPEGTTELTVTYADEAGNESVASAPLTVTIDSTAPDTPVSAPGLDAESDTGAAGDNITSDATPTLTGTGGTPGDEVTLYDGAGNVLGTGIVAEDGSWSVTPDSDLPEGTTELTVTYADEAGNESAASAPLTVTVESTGPDAPASAPVLDSASDTGVLGDGVTSDTSPTLTGTGGTPGDEVTLYDATGNVLGTGIVAEDGSWSVTPDSDLPEGTTELTVTYADEAGNESAASAPLTVTVDSTAPDAPANAPVLDPESDTGAAGDNITSDATPTLTGTGGTPGDEATLYDGAGNVLGTGIVAEDGSWSATPDSELAEGTQDLTVTYTDAAGNESTASAPLTLTIESTAPDSPASAPVLDSASDTGTPGDGITSNTTPTLTGTGGTPGDEVTLYDGAGNVLGTGTVEADGSWSVTPDSDLPEGTTELTVTYADEAGNESAASAPLTVTVDSTAPEAPANAPVLDPESDTGAAGDNITSDATPTLTGTGGTPGDEVTLYDAAGNVLGTGIVAEDGSWSATPDSELAEGTQDLTVTYTDAAGNESTASVPLTVTIDDTAPLAPVLAIQTDTGISSTDDVTNDGQVTVSGIESGATWEYSMDGGTTWSQGTGTGFLLPDGDYPAGAVQARQTDAAGRTGAIGETGQLWSIGGVFVEDQQTSVLEENLSGGTSQTSGTVNLGDLDGDPTSVTLVAPSQELFSKGESVSWQGTGTNELVGSNTVGEVIRVTIDDSGNYTVSLAQPLDHPVANVGDVVELAAGVIVSDGQSQAEGNLRVSILDDVPVVESNSLYFNVSSLPTTVADNILGATGSFGEDGGAVDAVSLGGLTWKYDAETNTVAAPAGVSQSVESYSFDASTNELEALTWTGETVSVNLMTGDFAYTATGIAQIPEEPNSAPSASTASGVSPGLLGGEVVGLIDLSEDQSASVNDADNNLVSVTYSYETTGVTTGLSFSASQPLANELGVSVVTTSNTGLLRSDASITFTATNGGELDLLKINEVLATVTFDPGLLSLGLLSTVTLTAIDADGASGSMSNTGLLDASLLNLELIDTSPASTIQEGGSDDDTLTGDQQESLDDRLYGHAGNDLLQGGAGSDLLRGGLGQDTLEGGESNDTVIGGQGNDSLSGGAGTDVFRWEEGDAATPGAPSEDIVIDYTDLSLANGGDMIDLADLLQGEGAIGSNVGNLINYLHFDYNGTDTVLSVSSTGKFVHGYQPTQTDQEITFEGVNLVDSALSDEEVIQSLLASGQLVVDQADENTIFDGGFTDLQIKVGDGDGDTETVNIRFDQSNTPAQTTEGNSAPDVQQSEGALLSLAGISALNLIDFSAQGLNASDRDNNLQTVTVSYEPIATIDTGSLGSVPSLTYSSDLADELGLEVTLTNDPGVAGLVEPRSVLVITSSNGDTLDNFEVNELLATVTFQQDLSLLDSVARAEVLNSTTITAVDDLAASATSSVTELASLNLLSPTDGIQEGDGGDNVIEGGAGDDRLYGYTGNDTLSGGNGNDLLRGGLGNDQLEGGAGNDILIGGLGADSLSGGEGDDVLIVGDTGYTTIDGGVGFDTLMLEDGVNLDFATAPATDVERLDLRNQEGESAIALTEDAIVALTDDDNELQIIGDGNETVELTGASVRQESVEADGAVFNVYDFGVATVLVDEGTTVIM